MGNGEPPELPRIDAVIWMALLVGRDVRVPCHFAGPHAPWGCAYATDFARCEELPTAPWPAAPELLAEHDAARGSSSIACSGLAVGIMTACYSTVIIAACGPHRDWLYHHAWCDGMNSGMCGAIGPEGIWKLVNWWEDLDVLIERWRTEHPGWEGLDAADRESVAARFPLPVPDWDLSRFGRDAKALFLDRRDERSRQTAPSRETAPSASADGGESAPG